MTDAPDVVVDASNVCCDRRFDDTGDLARWDRMVAVLDAYQEQVDSGASVLAIADANLERKLSAADKHDLREAVAEGWCRVVQSDADAMVLLEASRHDAKVISRDRFVDYRSHHDWIDDNTTQFYDWRRTPSGVTVRPRDMGRHTGFSVSRAAEKTMLKERGMLDRSGGRERIRETLLDQRYVCDNPACIAAKLTPDDIGIPLRRRDGSPACPSCKQDVLAVGPRPAGRQLKLVVGDDVHRFQVTVDEPKVLGRGQTAPEGVDPSLLLDDDLRRRISREHLQLRVVGTRVAAVDLDSSGGTSLRRWDGREGKHAEEVPLEAGAETFLNARDELLLAGLVTVTLSGQRFAVRGS